MIKKIGVLTSGGDSPGMNAAIRAIVRTGINQNLQIVGIHDGYLGLYNNNMATLNRYSVSNMLNKGGTFLGSSRFPEFNQKHIRYTAIQNIKKKNIDNLIIIGGNGSYIGAKKLNNMGIPCICIPASIDNDIVGTDYTIGYFTALQTIVESIDRLRDTSSSHQRISIVEVMGRNCGDLTLSAAIAGGCEFIIIPEIPYKKEYLLKEIKNSIQQNKKHTIIAITECICDVNKLAKYIEIYTNRETRATILGHIQRGGIPVAYDRILASKMGAYAISLIIQGYKGKCISIKNEKIIHHDISMSITNIKKKNKYKLFNMAKQLY